MRGKTEEMNEERGGGAWGGRGEREEEGQPEGRGGVIGRGGAQRHRVSGKSRVLRVTLQEKNVIVMFYE